ncbi:MAG: aromatic acid exporter family protein [Clostridium sp.]|uniref:aromatic acid exporter family protein n=1 Tax=Clostridium sp. TaxID=1506 RepID=UPI003EE42EC8
MKKARQFFMELSISDEVKALKVLIASLIAIFLSSFDKHLSATTTVITISIIFAFLPTVSATRSYCIQRVIVNFIGATITLIIGILLNWNIYALALISSVTMLIYYKLNLAKQKLSLVSLIAASTIFFMIMSTPSATETRFVSIIVGSILAILVNELFLPLNQGFKLEKSIQNFSLSLFKLQNILLSDIDISSSDDLKGLNKLLVSIKPNIDTLEKELTTISLTNHLRHYYRKISFLKSLGDVSMASYELIDTIFENKETFNSLQESNKLYLKELFSNLAFNHKLLFDKYFKNDFKKTNINLITFNNSKLDINNDINILILSKLIKYRNTLITLNSLYN